MSGLRTFLRRLWPKRLMGQTILLVLIALFSAQIISALIIRSEARDFYRGAESRFIAVRIAPIALLLRDMPADQQDRITAALSNRRLHVWMSNAPVVDKNTGDDADGDSQTAESLAARITGELGEPFNGPVHVFRHRRDDDDAGAIPQNMRDAMQQNGVPGGAHAFHHDATVVSIGIAADRWMNAALQHRPPRRLIRPDSWFTFFVAALTISVIVVIALRRITRPLGALSDAARKLGRGEDIQPLAEAGPADVRETIRAFNEMQDRLGTFVTERTRMLAAVSHDLRTPITALRLRAEMLDDAETRERMIETLSDMQNMIEATLAFARGDAADEPTRPTDLAALLGAIADDLRDLGYAVEVTAPATLRYPCRTLALRRALTNLIDNAATYGERARVSLSTRDGAPQIIIEDDGPGIPDAELERIFEPFVRLDTSRSTETGGSGLGLSIARDIVHRHGGGIALENLKQGGLRVTVTLPVATG